MLAVLLSWWLDGKGDSRVLATFFAEVFLMVLYHYFYSGISRSVSVTFLIRFLEAPGQSIPLDDLTREYSASSRFEDRILLMEKSGFVGQENGVVVLRPKGIRLVKVIRFLGFCLGTRHQG